MTELERLRTDLAGAEATAETLRQELEDAQRILAAMRSDEALRVAELRQAREGCAQLRASHEFERKRAAQAEQQRGRAAMRYMNHLDSCAHWTLQTEEYCSCGLAKARAALTPPEGSA